MASSSKIATSTPSYVITHRGCKDGHLAAAFAVNYLGVKPENVLFVFPDGKLTDEQKAILEGQEVLMVDVTLINDLDWLVENTSLTHLDHEEHIKRHNGVYTTDACGAKMLSDYYGL